MIFRRHPKATAQFPHTPGPDELELYAALDAGAADGSSLSQLSTDARTVDDWRVVLRAAGVTGRSGVTAAIVLLLLDSENPTADARFVEAVAFATELYARRLRLAEVRS